MSDSPPPASRYVGGPKPSVIVASILSTRACVGTGPAGKWPSMELPGRYRDGKGADFRLGEFHDRPLESGSLPLSVVGALDADAR